MYLRDSWAFKNKRVSVSILIFLCFLFRSFSFECFVPFWFICFSLFLLHYIVFALSFLTSDRKRVDLVERRGGKELEGVGGGEKRQSEYIAWRKLLSVKEKIKLEWDILPQIREHTLLTGRGEHRNCCRESKVKFALTLWWGDRFWRWYSSEALKHSSKLINQELHLRLFIAILLITAKY